MSPLIKKEIRLLLPAWMIAMPLAIISPWVLTTTWYDTNSLDFFFRLLFSIAVLLLGISSFGQEFNSGVFTIFLSQPLERRRLWNTKITILTIAFILVWLAATISFLIRFNIVSPHFNSEYSTQFVWSEYRTSTLEILTVSSVVAFSGGLWTTLLLRQVTAAFWITLLIPTAFFFTITLVCNYLPISDVTANDIILVMLFIYSAAGFYWARHLFLRAQDVQWTGGDFSFTWRKEVPAAQSAYLASRPRHWLSAFAWKEIQLQQINILIAIVIFVFHITSVLIRKIHPHFTNQDTAFILETVWVFWLLLPLLIGSASVAEERKLGIMESQLCLPLSRSAQLFIKFAVGMVLSLFFGGFMPLVIEGTKYLNDWIYMGAAAIFFLAFYASTVVRTTLQAMGLAIGLIIVIFLFHTVTGVDFLHLDFVFQEYGAGVTLLKFYIGIPILALVLGGLAAWNFKWLHQGGKCLRGNFAGVAAAFLFITGLTSAIFFRTWEFLTPTDPAHGPARLGANSEIEFVNSENTLYAVLPDGRLWTETLGLQSVSNRWTGWRAMVLVPKKSRVQFIGASNWVDVACNSYQAVGIQSNGTLWVAQRDLSRGRWEPVGAFRLSQIGTGTDWSQAAGESMGFLLLKKDGTLWHWGTHGYDWHDTARSMRTKLKQDLADLPVSVSNNSRFTTLISSDFAAFAKKDDGSLWRWISWDNDKFVSKLIEETNFDADSSYLQGWGGDMVEVKTNGQLSFTSETYQQNRKPVYKTSQFGEDEKWKAAARMNWHSIFAVRNDNTLWKWSYTPWQEFVPHSPPVELGRGWVTLTSSWDFAIALNADGTLWAWDQPSSHLWLTPSRKPLYLGNIFDNSTAP